MPSQALICHEALQTPFHLGGSGYGAGLFIMILDDLMKTRRPADMYQTIQNMFGEDGKFYRQAPPVFPAIDIAENHKDFKIRTEISPENIDIRVDHGYLTICGEPQEEEISYGSFSRTIALPDNADMDRAQAVFEDNMLIIEVPKRGETARKWRKLDIHMERRPRG